MSEMNFLFSFLKYIQPLWYLNLKSKATQPYWVDYLKLGKEEQALLTLDDQYSTEEGRLRDAAYQAWQKGIMQVDPVMGLKQIVKRLPIVDEYRFIKKYFHPAWSFYVLLIRLLSFRNPVVEIYSFFRNNAVKKINVFQDPKLRTDYDKFQSSLVAQSPLVTVIIPTLNRKVYLKDALDDLGAQVYKNFEVIVVDQNEKLEEAFYTSWPFTIHAIHQYEKALWLARNTAVKMAKGTYLLLFDDDSRVDAEWIVHHLKCIDYFKCQISAGVSISSIGDRIPQNYSYFRWADQLDTGNVMIHKEVFKTIGLFDRQFERQRMGDGEFGLRSYLAGFQSISNPLAKRLHLKIETGGLREMGSWDAFRNKKWFAPRPVPSVLYLIRRYYDNESALRYLIKMFPSMMIPYRYKGNRILMAGSFIVAIPFFPLLLIPIIISWLKSSAMLKKGPLIEFMK